MSPRLLANGHAFNDNVFFWHVLVHTATTGCHTFDFVYHVHAFNHFSKYAVAPTLQAFAREVQEVVINHVDEELGSCRVRCLSTGHCQRTTGIFQTVVRFVFDRVFGGFLFHARFKTAALNHKAVDNTVENGVVVKTFAAVVQEVFNCFRCFIVKSFDDNIAVIGVESNHFCILFRLIGASTRFGSYIGWCYSITARSDHLAMYADSRGKYGYYTQLNYPHMSKRNLRC
ncbi:conserved hypothetical protein [Escherichia coli APEC O1]|uniref:Uncharacterized protein n=1 Tax=Escherichia coli O1:K1 / APEC TaxID=405955 RepID=A0A0H2YWN6_ECOK1|nr:conserved hypothetical protein [Escherichia coli APEC O1]